MNVSSHKGREKVKAIQLLQLLKSSRTSIDQLKAPPEPGVYALFLIEEATLANFSALPDQPIYIGRSINLAKREFDNHFNSSGTGWSTVRRSLGALLKSELQLVAQPPSRGISPANYYCYCFNSDGEGRLTKWMRKHIHVAVQAVEDNKTVESELINLGHPLLNLKGWANPDAREIRRLRKVCADEARGLSG